MLTSVTRLVIICKVIQWVLVMMATVLCICDNKYLAIFTLYDNRRDNDN